MQRILIDAPSYDSPKSDDTGTDIGKHGKHEVEMRLTPENGSAVANFINGLAEL